MKRTLSLIFYPKRQILARQGISAALVYLFLLPYQIHRLQTWGEMSASREIFKTDQLFLPLLLLWSLFQFFLPVYQSGTKESMQVYRHPVFSASLLLMGIQQLVYVPLYIWTYLALPHFHYIVGILIFQLACVGTLFAAALYVFGSPTVNMGIGLAYIGVSMPLAESVVPLLFRPNRMIDGFLLDYWVIHIGIQLALCVLLFVWQRRNAKYGGGYPRL